MNKRFVTVIILAGIIILGAINGSENDKALNSDATLTTEVTGTAELIREKETPVCDGIDTTEDCTVDGIAYKTYIYHPPVVETTHIEYVTTYKEEIVGYCTLCSDGTYSPSCATGRGACSHHGGVAQWNASRYKKVAVQEARTVIDSPAREAYFEKVANLE